MSDSNEALEALRQAVDLAPDNVALAMHYGNTLLSMLRYAEAEEQFKSLLSRHPNSKACKVGLADTYYRQDKNSHSLAIVETMIQGKEAFPAALVLHAKLMYRAGEVRTAVSSYKQAIDMDDDVADEKLGGTARHSILER